MAKYGACYAGCHFRQLLHRPSVIRIAGWNKMDMKDLT